MFRGRCDEDIKEVLRFETTWPGSAVLRERAETREQSVETFLDRGGIPFPSEFRESSGWRSGSRLRRMKALEGAPDLCIRRVLNWG